MIILKESPHLSGPQPAEPNHPKLQTFSLLRVGRLLRGGRFSHGSRRFKDGGKVAIGAGDFACGSLPGDFPGAPIDERIPKQRAPHSETDEAWNVPWVTRLDDRTMEAIAGPDMALFRRRFSIPA